MSARALLRDPNEFSAAAREPIPGEALLEGPLAFVDVETTGGHPAWHRVIEIGIVAATGTRFEYEWSTLVNPGVPIPPMIQHFTGITDEMVRCAPFFEDVADELLQRLEGRLFIAHNVRFDYGFLRSELKRAGRRFNSRTACTVKLSRRLHPAERHHNLDAIIERHGLQCERRHRALADAQVLWQLWCTLRKQRPAEQIGQALAEIAQLPSLPAHLSPELADELPEGPGVYRFYGEGDALLYVGKARNIRQRVLAHWQSASRDMKSQRLTEQTRRVEWTDTAGELGALLLEARLVRELKPLFNRQLRGSSQVWTWLVTDDGAAPQLAPLDQMQLSFEAADAFGLFRTEAAARKTLTQVAREHKLCLKMLGLERTAGSCFAYQIQRCAGACVGAESLSLHTARLKMALAPYRLKEWPFRGPVGIREVSPTGLEQIHVIDQWRHVATLEPGDPLPERRTRSSFDIDVYHILTRHLGRLGSRSIFELPVDEDES